MTRRELAVELIGLAGPFTKIARAMARTNKLEVVPTGLGARTDGKTIFIPFTSDLLPLELRQVLHGKLDHELQHVIEERRAEKAGRKTPIQIMASEVNPVIRMLFNVYEDVRIERLAARRHPGVAENLRANSKYNFNAIKSDSKLWGKFWHRLGGAIIFTARDEFDISFYDLATRLYLSEISDLVERSKSTLFPEQCLELAQETYERVKKARGDAGKAPAEPEKHSHGEREDGTDEESGASEEKDANSEPESEKDGREGRPSEKDADKSDDSEKPVEDEEDEAAAAKRAMSKVDLDDAPLDDLSKAGDTRLEEEVRVDAEKHNRYIPHPDIKKADRFITPNFTKKDLDLVEKVRGEMAQVTGGLRTRMKLVIQGRARRRVVSGLDSGKLDDGLLTEVRVGNRHVFNDVFEGEALDTAIEHLVDLSGSMGINDDSEYVSRMRHPRRLDTHLELPSEFPRMPAHYAIRGVLALAEAWNSIRVANEFMGFDNNDDRLYHLKVDPSPDFNYQIRSPFDYYWFKRWEERLPAVRGRFANIKGMHQNSDGEAVWTAAQRLALRPESRKILVVISDGSPCDHGDASALHKHLRDVVRAITRTGIEVIGIGCGTTAPAKFYNAETGAHNLLVKDMPRFPLDLFNLMYKTVLKRRRGAK